MREVRREKGEGNRERKGAAFCVVHDSSLLLVAVEGLAMATEHKWERRTSDNEDEEEEEQGKEGLVRFSIDYFVVNVEEEHGMRDTMPMRKARKDEMASSVENQRKGLKMQAFTSMRTQNGTFE